MDTINTFQDLLDILDAKPEWAQALRVRLLTPELLALPEKFAEFVEIANRRFGSLERDVADLKSDMVTVKADVADLKGFAIPVAAQRMTGIIAQTINVRRPRWLDTTQIVDIADDAEDQGRANIPANEMQSFRAIDLAMTAIDKATGETHYVVIECSYTATQNDVIRARRNADHMTRFTGTSTKAVVASNIIPDSISLFAKEQDVACVTVTNKATTPR